MKILEDFKIYIILPSSTGADVLQDGTQFKPNPNSNAQKEIGKNSRLTQNFARLVIV